MFIDPKVTRLIIFNGGGGICEREIKLSLTQGTNEFQIQNIPASFDPNSADIKLEYINSEDKEFLSLQQTIVSLPDRTNTQQLIDREKSAAKNIISYSIDFTREMREQISTICEASSYRTYSDTNGKFDFIINARKEGEVIVKIIYFIADLRMKWQTTLQVNLSDDNEAEIEGFIVVDNQTGFSYNNVDLGFAIFELPATAPELVQVETTTNIPMEQQAFTKLNEQKRTQRMKNLML